MTQGLQEIVVRNKEGKGLVFATKGLAPYKAAELKEILSKALDNFFPDQYIVLREWQDTFKIVEGDYTNEAEH